MTIILFDDAQPERSPFDRIRHVRDDGTEWWSARELMPHVDYSKWQHFQVPLQRALKAAEVQGFTVSDHFTRSRKIGPTRGFVEDATVEDYELSRFAAYLVAMNCDPNKPQVAAAQTYFAVQTRRAETSTPQPVPTFAEIERLLADPQTMIGVLSAYKTEKDARQAAEAQVAALEPPARAWQQLADAHGDYAVADAAKVLSRDPAITIGQNTLFRWMGKHGWIYRRENTWHADQTKIKAGLLTEKPGHPYWSEKHKRWENGDPQVRVTLKGVERLYALLGGNAPLPELEVA